MLNCGAFFTRSNPWSCARPPNWNSITKKEVILYFTKHDRTIFQKFLETIHFMCIVLHTNNRIISSMFSNGAGTDTKCLFGLPYIITFNNHTLNTLKQYP